MTSIQKKQYTLRGADGRPHDVHLTFSLAATSTGCG